MSEQKISKNKIGARCLSDLETELILPTYKRIYHQIDQFRMEKESINRNNQDENHYIKYQGKAQKTNNIGIIGVRGAGKTSILKTIRIQLEKNKRTFNDIILPIIVPENMSESGTLMATILGMLSEVIKEKEAEEQKRQQRNNADCIRKTSLRMKCDEVIKQYTYIQKEYRDILIRQYTTENDYVNRSARVFNSDTEFINKFNELIDELINVKKQDDGLLFLFIDDIDLSTYRCADVVKTLLSYLSNDNIVTFISGDLETFEEALTLDFLRQENALNNEILEKKVGDNTLLDSKKLLAYEYLKKIIPPAYRYNIKYWSLEEKGNYCIEDSAENQGEGRTLSDLLFQALEDWIDPAFFRYAENEDWEEGSNQKEIRNNTTNIEGVLPYTYHLFDNTSRGLNNIYNVLSEIAESRKGNETDHSKEKKLLLDTIITSKPIYNKYRNEIQQNFFHVGTVNGNSRVFFDNARVIIYKRDMSNTDMQQDQKGYQKAYYIKDPIERFSLFILADFAARILYEKDYEKQIKEDESYRVLKEEAMKDLFFNPVIAEKIMDTSKYSWESKEEIYLRNGELRKEDKEYLSLKDMKLKDVNGSFLLKGDLVLNLAYYKNLPLDGMLKLYEDKLSDESDREKMVSAELEQSTVIAMWKAFSSLAYVNEAEGRSVSEFIAKYYSVFWKEIAYIRNQLSSSVTQNIAIRLFDDEINAVVGRDNYKAELKNAATWRERKEKDQLRRILSNTLAYVLKAQKEDVIQEDWQEVYFDDLYLVEKNKEVKKIEKGNDEEKKIEKRVQILKEIDSAGLWRAEAAGDAVSYLRSAIRKYLRFIKMVLEEGKDWRLNTSEAYDGWYMFQNTYVGESMTIARRTLNSVAQILEENQADFQQGMSLETYRKVIVELLELAGNNRVWYGQSEAQRILNELQKASAEPGTQEKDWDTWIKKHSYFRFLLQCLYKYKIEVEKSDSIVQNARLLAHITEMLSVAHKDADRQTLENFICELNRNLDDKIDSDIFGELFSSQPTQKQEQSNDK